MKIVTTAAALGIVAGLAGPASAQSLFLQAPPTFGPEAPLASPELEATSMFFVAPPEAPTYRVHDIVHVIINETSSASSSQSLETTKELRLQNELENFIDPLALLELRLRAAATQDLALLNAESINEFTGEGDYDRQDQLNARIAAEIIDVKPNGTLILRARKTISTDGEQRTITLTGTARGDDITRNNTILSSQLADLAVEANNDGEVRKAARKGIITRALEFIFNY